MKINEIAFVAYAITDVGRSRHFYENILGLKPASVFEQDGMAFIEYWIGVGGEHCLALGKGAPSFQPGKAGATAALEVDDFDSAVKDLRAAKVKVLMEPYDSPMCLMMLVEDPDGNQLMIHKRKPVPAA